ncbi:uncharacterized protein At1g10890-like [Benincasa hispida]|uniref:uncharacterized protein At1g10890-like n=1 Tax=Benincasa hispida TaxID=102211 RepID=UPI001900987E|nr:uncharacterized protein At1g10890-like [Benincasa hispida]
MIDQASQPSASPSTLSTDQTSMQEAVFLVASRHLATQPHTVLRIAGRPWRNPLAVRPPPFKRGQSTESTPLPTPAISTESEKKIRDCNEIFGNILSNLEEGGGLPEVGVVNQPLSTEKVTVAVIEEVRVVEEVAVTEEVVEEETKRSTLALETPEETTQVESYDGPIRVALEEVAAEKQQEVEEEKKKKKEKKEKNVGEEEKERRRTEEEERQDKMERAKLITTRGDRRRRLHDEEVRHNNEISRLEEIR